jgi:hypothetical protein
MALEYQVNPNDSMFIRLQLGANDTGLYPQAKIYSIDDPTTVVDTVDLDEIGSGLYGIIWTNNGTRAKYFTQTKVYTDAGHTSLHPLIRPDSDSINVGFNSTGGVFAGARGNVTQRLDLTKEEIERIAKAVKALLDPELKLIYEETEKKSEFDPNRDLVKTDIVIPEIEFPQIPEPQKIDITDLIAKISQIIIDNKVVVPENKDYSAILEEIMNTISEDKFDYSRFEELKEAIENVVKENKVEIPENKDYEKDFKLLNAALGQFSLESEKKPIEVVLDLIDLKDDTLEIYKNFRTLEAKDKERIFNLLAKNDKELLKELAKYGEAEMVLERIKQSKDKNAEFNRSALKIRELLPIIKRLANV